MNPMSSHVIDRVMAEIDMEGETYIEEYQKIKRWKMLQKKLKSRMSIEEVEDELLLEFSDEFGNLTKPTLTYGHRPILHCFVDDAQSSKLVFAGIKKEKERTQLIEYLKTLA